jgi:hypothetical protein
VEKAEPWKARKTKSRFSSLPTALGNPAKPAGFPLFPQPRLLLVSQTTSGNLIVVDRKECLTPDSRVKFREYTHTKLVGEALKADAYHLSLTSDFVRKLAALRIGDTIAWGRPTRIDITKLSANEFLGREYPNDEEVKCALTGELLEIEASIRPLYLNQETISKLAQMKVGDTVTLYLLRIRSGLLTAPSVEVLCAVRRLKNGRSSNGTPGWAGDLLVCTAKGSLLTSCH